MTNKELNLTNNGEDIIVDDTFIIDTKELIQELENIGDYEGIKELEADIETLNKKVSHS